MDNIMNRIMNNMNKVFEFSKVNILKTSFRDPLLISEYLLAVDLVFLQLSNDRPVQVNEL